MGGRWTDRKKNRSFDRIGGRLRLTDDKERTTKSGRQRAIANIGVEIIAKSSFYSEPLPVSKKESLRPRSTAIYQTALFLSFHTFHSQEPQSRRAERRDFDGAKSDAA